MDTNCRKKFHEWKKGNMNIRRWVKEMKRAADTTGLAFVWPNQQKCSIWKIRKLIKYKWKKERKKMMSQRSSLNSPPPRADGKNDCTYTSILSIYSHSLARETVTFYWERKRRENVVKSNSLKNQLNQEKRINKYMPYFQAYRMLNTFCLAVQKLEYVEWNFRVKRGLIWTIISRCTNKTTILKV